MFNTSTQERINKLMEEKEERDKKIKALVKNIDAQLLDLNQKITVLTEDYVNQEISGNSEALVNIDKAITETRLTIENLQGKKAAYEKLATEDKLVKDAIPKILDSARKDRDKRHSEIQKKQDEKKAIELKIRELEKDIEAVNIELSVLNVDREAQLIMPLLNFIAPRKVKTGFETSYLNTLLDNSPEEYLEQYLE